MTRESKRSRDDFFKPVTALPQRNRSVPVKFGADQSQKQKERYGREMANRLDSLALRSPQSGVLIIHADSLSVKENKPETVQSKFGQGGTTSLMSNNGHVRQSLVVGTQKDSGDTSSISSKTKKSYSDGLALFRQRRYEDAHQLFAELVYNGIEDDLKDNCEYWMGECHFAKEEFLDAITHFEKVISLGSTNKKADAYFMLGKIYEQIGDRDKSRLFYKEFRAQYPNNALVKSLKSRQG